MAEKFEFQDKHVFAIRDSLRVFHDELLVFLTSQVFEPRPGSQAAQELATTEERKEKLRTAISQGSFLIQSAADHLALFAKALDEPRQPLAAFTCARAAIEASAYSAWLLEPAIDVNERIARSLGRRDKGMEEQRKYAEAQGVAPMAAQAKQRKDAIAQDSQTLKIAPSRDLGPTDMIKRVLGKEPDYRILSGVAHGHQWALQQCGFEINSWTLARQPLAKKVLKPTLACVYGISAVDAITKASWFMTRINGMDLVAFARIADGFYERIGMEHHKPPFWRKNIPR